MYRVLLLEGIFSRSFKGIQEFRFVFVANKESGVNSKVKEKETSSVETMYILKCLPSFSIVCELFLQNLS